MTLSYLFLTCLHRVGKTTVFPPPGRKEITSDLIYQLNSPLGLAFHELTHAFSEKEMIYFVFM